MRRGRGSGGIAVKESMSFVVLCERDTMDAEQVVGPGKIWSSLSPNKVRGYCMRQESLQGCVRKPTELQTAAK